MRMSMWLKLNINKNRFCVCLLILTILCPSVGFSKARHPFREREKQKRIEEQAKSIPLYLKNDFPDRAFDFVKFVKADGLFTKTNEKVYSSLRVKALEVNGDAVVGVECRRIGRSVAISCYGEAVRWK